MLAHEPSYYKAIVLDISMPIMGGVEACIKILEYFKSAKTHISKPFIYALTSESEQHVLKEVKAAGF